MRTSLLVAIVLSACSGAATSADAGHLVLDAEIATSCDQVRANAAIPHGAVVGIQDTHLPCVGALFCGVDCVEVTCEDGTLRVSEAGHTCLDAATTDASIDAGPAVTTCGEVSANPSIPHGAVSGDVDTRIRCAAPLICSVGCVNVMCEGGTLHLTEAGHTCFGDAGTDAGDAAAGDAATDDAAGR